MATGHNFGLRGKQRDSYLELVGEFPLTSIRSDEHLAAAQQVMDRLLARPTLNVGGQTYLEALGDLVALYEDQHHAIGPASDADMLRHLLDAKGISPAALSQQAGVAKSTISEILAGKRPFSRQTIRKLAAFFAVDVSLLAGNL